MKMKYNIMFGWKLDGWDKFVISLIGVVFLFVLFFQDVASAPIGAIFGAVIASVVFGLIVFHVLWLKHKKK